MPLISPSLAGLAPIGAAVRLGVHELEVQELEIQEQEVQSWRFGQELEFQDMGVLKQKVQKLEVQEPELWGEGVDGIKVGHLGALGWWRRLE